MKNLKFWLLPMMIITIGTNHIWSQLYEVSLESRIHYSQLIVEGKVLDAQSFIPEGAGNIFTTYLVEVSQILKGNTELQYLQIVEMGGTVGGQNDWVSHAAQLPIGQPSVFFVRRSNIRSPLFPEHSPPEFQLYAGSQGVIYLNPSGRTVGGNDLFANYKNIKEEVYDLINPTLSPKIRIKNEMFTQQKGVLSITGFFPRSISGGTGSLLTIQGTDFGMTKGIVSFRNADDGGTPLWVRADPADILTWEDTLITCLVPSVGPWDSLDLGVAGSGPIKVTTSTANSVVSSDTLEIIFSIRNLRRGGIDHPASYNFLLDTNGLGGYTFQYSPSFNDSSDAVEVFEATLRNWRCNSGVNFVVGPTTPKNISTRDGTNIVKWNDDLTDALRAGELARTTVRRDICVDGVSFLTLFYVFEIDIVFKDTSDMFFDTTALPPATKFDFFTISLHELGHAHLLNHVIEENSLMFYATSVGRSVRVIDGDQLSGAAWVMDSSTIWHSFCPSQTPNPMIRVPMASCNIIDGIEEPLSPFGRSISIFPNPTNEDLFFMIDSPVRRNQLSISITDPLGRTKPIENDIISEDGNSTYRIPEGVLFSGINFLRIVFEDEVFTTTVIKN